MEQLKLSWGLWNAENKEQLLKGFDQMFSDAAV